MSHYSAKLCGKRLRAQSRRIAAATLTNSGRHFGKNTKKHVQKAEIYRFFNDLGHFVRFQTNGGRHFVSPSTSLTISPSNSETSACEQANSFSHFG